jgi:hypothetical protein
MKRFLVYLCSIFLILPACRKNSVTAVTILPPPDTSLQKMMPFKMGAAIDPNLLKGNAKYAAVGRKMP